jgi:LPS-assembly protein
MVRREYGGRRGSGMAKRRSLFGLMTLLGVAGCVLAPLPGLGQGMSDLIAKRMQSKQSGDKKQPLLVEARELVYNSENETVSAVGDVQLFYDGRVLEADKVTYNRKTRQVFAEGNAKLTEANGQVAYGDRFELTDDFRDGFIDSLRIETTDKTRFSAPRAERIDGETTVFDKGTYTACDGLQGQPGKAAFVAGARQAHHPQGQRAYGLLRGCHAGVFRHSGCLYSVFLRLTPPSNASRVC